MKYVQYMGYVLRHKFFVARTCFEQGLIWRGLAHDMSKLYPDEFFPYVESFYGEDKKNPQVRAKFNKAWGKHQERNSHHWQWWISRGQPRPMSPAARLEMVCDWCGASLAQGKGGWSATKSWYAQNRDKMTLHPETRQWVEEFLGRIPT